MPNAYELGPTLDIASNQLSLTIQDSGGEFDNAYEFGEEVMTELQNVNSTFNPPESGVMYDLKDGRGSVCTSADSSVSQFLKHSRDNHDKFTVYFIPSVLHESEEGEWTRQYEGYVTKVIAEDGKILFSSGGGVGMESSVKSILSSVYGSSVGG